VDRTPEAQFVAGAVATVHQYAAMIAGICPECSGAVETSLDVCTDHPTSREETWPPCQRRYPAQARFVCTVYKNRMWGPPSVVVAHPPVVALYADRGVDPGTAGADLDDVTRVLTTVRDHDYAELSGDAPRRIRVVFRCDGDRRGGRSGERPVHPYRGRPDRGTLARGRRTRAV
jgi:hypothetical protein